MSHTSRPHFPAHPQPPPPPPPNPTAAVTSAPDIYTTHLTTAAEHPAAYPLRSSRRAPGGDSRRSSAGASASTSGSSAPAAGALLLSPPTHLVSPHLGSGSQLSPSSYPVLPPAAALVSGSDTLRSPPLYQLRDFGVLRQASASSSSANPPHHYPPQHGLHLPQQSQAVGGLSAHRAALHDFPTLQIPPQAKFLPPLHTHAHASSSASTSVSPYETQGTFPESGSLHAAAAASASSSSSRRHQYTSPHSPFPLVSTPGLQPYSASSTISFEERAYRSPHPPLTAAIGGQFYLPPIQVSPFERDHLGRPYLSSPVTFPSIPAPLAAAPLSASSSRSHSHSHPDSYLLQQPGSASLVHLAPPPLQHHHSYHGQGYGHNQHHYPPPPHTAIASAYRPASPIRIPEPLRFNFSASPPTMPRVMQTQPMPHSRYNGALPSTATTTNGSSIMHSITPSINTPSGSIRGSRANPKGWTVENTYDSDGRKKEVVVIHDTHTPEQMPRKRTRAVAAQEAAAAENLRRSQLGLSNGYGSVSSHSGTVASVQGAVANKKRKIDDGSDASSAKKAKAKGSDTSLYRPAQPAVQSKAGQPVQDPQATSQTPWDDAEGHYIIKPDDIIGGRYKIVRLLGQGTFGKVVEARHLETRAKVAIKVIRAVQKYRDASRIEVRVLQALKKNDPANDKKCIHLQEVFDYRNHPCLVSELYGMSVFDFLKQNHFQPFPDRHIQDFAKSLLNSVAFLHSLHLIHTDLKPENILLVSNEAWLQGQRTAKTKQKRILRNTDIRLIDFGSATFENEYHSTVVSTRHYRAPEIILGLPWSYPCDMFSIGCILVEFYTGDALFQTHDNLEHLAMMEIVMGKMPSRMIEKGRQKKAELFRGTKIDYPNAQTSKASKKFVKGLKSLSEIIPPTSTHNKLFLDLIIRLLEFDPDARLDVVQALKHPYLRATIPEPKP